MTDNAKLLLNSLVSKYKSGQLSFDMGDCCQFNGWEELIIELHNSGYVYYDDSNIAETISLTEDGIGFKD